jgi:hypothetical protein
VCDIPNYGTHVALIDVQRNPGLLVVLIRIACITVVRKMHIRIEVEAAARSDDLLQQVDGLDEIQRVHKIAHTSASTTTKFVSTSNLERESYLQYTGAGMLTLRVARA